MDTTEKAIPQRLTGRARLVPNADVDTDMIFHNRHLHITEPKEMTPHIFGNLPGFESFPKDAQTGDILVVGHNFGCGSSRQQAVDGFISLGIAAVVGESFGAIYKRNAINAGWMLMECPGIVSSGIKDGEMITLDLESGVILRYDGSIIAEGKPLSPVQRQISAAGGLLNLAKTAAAG